MNLKKLLDLQRPLRERIIQKHNLEGQDLFPNMNLALLVEVGELANAWRGFKHWSKKPVCTCAACEKKRLDEYADGLSFILELGLETGFEVAAEYEQYRKSNITGQLLLLFDVVSFFYYNKTSNSYERIIKVFLGLGAMLGFDWEQIEQAYMQKNAVNFQRQEEGY